MISSKEEFMEQREWEQINDDGPVDYLDDLPFGDEGFENIQLAQLTPSKRNVSLLAAGIAAQVREGKINAVEAAVRLNAMQNMCKEALEAIRSDVVDELGKNKGKDNVYGCKVERIETAINYDYSVSSDWKMFSSAEKKQRPNVKIEERLKTIPSGKLLVDEETGETLTGPPKTSTTSFKVTLAK